MSRGNRQASQETQRDALLSVRTKIARQLEIEDLSKVFYDGRYWWAKQDERWKRLDYDSSSGTATTSC